MSADVFPSSGSERIIPMKALYNRIDEVRDNRKDLPKQLRNIGQEMPQSFARRAMSRLADAVEQNASAADLVARFPQHCWLLTVQSTEATTEAMTAMLEQSAFQHAIQTKKVRTVAYPVVLMVIAVAMMLVACAWLIPPFDRMYQEFALNLPPQTKLLISLSRVIVNHPFLVFAGFFAFLILTSSLLWFWIGDSRLKRTLMGTSVDHPSVRQALAKVAMQLAELIDEDVKMDRALRIAAESTPEPILRSVMADLAVQASEDASRLKWTRAAMYLPPNFLFALEASAGSPNTTLLRELSISYRDLSIRHKDWTGFLLGQITVISVGLFIAFIVISLFAPFVNLISALSS